MAIAEIDLRRDLPKVRENWDALMLRRGKCRYDAPCAIGAMVPAHVRKALDEAGGVVGVLLDRGDLVAPAEQRRDLSHLQHIFDCRSRKEIADLIAQLEAKYLPREISNG